MPVLSTDLILIERSGVPYRATINDIPSGVASGTATLTAPSGARVFELIGTTAVVGMVASRPVVAWLSGVDDADENDPELLDVKSISALALTNQIRFTLSFGVPVSGPIKLNWSAF